jgi:hypothetical protein
MFFDLSGASLSHASSGDPLAKVIIPLVLIALLVASWALRPQSRRLAGAVASLSPAREAALSHA